MSNGYTAQYVRIVETDDEQHPITLRFGPHTDAKGNLTDRWTVEHLSGDQARRLVYDLASVVGLKVQEPAVVLDQAAVLAS